MRIGNGLYRAVVCGWLTGATLLATDVAIGRPRGAAAGGAANGRNQEAGAQNANNQNARRFRNSEAPGAPNAYNSQNRFAGPGNSVQPYQAPYRAPYQAPYANPYGNPYQTPYGASGNYPAMNYGGNYARPSTATSPTPVVRALPPAPQPAASPRTAATKTPTPAAPPSYRETAAAHLYAQTRAATWDLYENYSANETYASTYRSMRGLLETVKSISTRIRKEATDTSARPALAASLQEADAMLQVLQAEIANWQPDPAMNRKPSDPELQTRLERMSATLADLMSAVAVPTTNLAALDDGPATTIRSKQPTSSGPLLAPTPIDANDPQEPAPTPAK